MPLLLIVGFLHALSDGVVRTYVAELLVASAWRNRGVGRAPLDACQSLAPTTRIDLLFPPADDEIVHDGLRLAIDHVNQELRARLHAGVMIFDSAVVLAGPDGWVRPEFAADALHLNMAGYAVRNAALVPLLTASVERNDE